MQDQLVLAVQDPSQGDQHRLPAAEGLVLRVGGQHPKSVSLLQVSAQGIPSAIQVIQDNPGLKDIYLGLEYKSPDYTYEEKEQGLNWAATQVLPYDPSRVAWT